MAETNKGYTVVEANTIEYVNYPTAVSAKFNSYGDVGGLVITDSEGDVLAIYRPQAWIKAYKNV